MTQSFTQHLSAIRAATQSRPLRGILVRLLGSFLLSSSIMELYPRSSRSSGQDFCPVAGVQCNCQICDIARLTLGYPAWHSKHSRPAGKPANPKIESPPPLLICPKCYSEYGPGKPHHCTKSAKQEALTDMV